MRPDALGQPEAAAVSITRIESEKRTIEFMVGAYCRNKHGGKPLCPVCADLLDYALKRLDLCRYGEAKTSCLRCPTRCYSPVRREEIRRVMRWAGPRMIYLKPLAFLRHSGG